MGIKNNVIRDEIFDLKNINEDQILTLKLGCDVEKFFFDFKKIFSRQKQKLRQNFDVKTHMWRQTKTNVEVKN